jgi:hypothetical protein
LDCYRKPSKLSNNPTQCRSVSNTLQRQLTSELVMAFPKADWQNALITDAATSTADTPGRLWAILTQVEKEGNFYAISFTSQQLKDH